MHLHFIGPLNCIMFRLIDCKYIKSDNILLKENRSKWKVCILFLFGIKQKQNRNKIKQKQNTD